ncbi:hypothetical protein [Streptomyces sp. ST2-7A]|uniref:hypothetical protein n=1 Tax=Streptomyces sp. ST2-7A TaxID=2907214 RepID=UPI001F3711FA|nr:hypothetical protein [Streptomyces sp. ST2-7A]MCE7080173.1 hypothetical protein [Streptomyces sp. ST2-7A]
MHPRNSETWRAIDRGDRPIDWAAWFGHPDGADYLSDAGRAVTERAIQDLDRFFSAKWLHRAMTADMQGRHTPIGLGRSAPIWYAGETAVGAWVEAVRWWAASTYLEKLRVPGLDTVRRSIRTDITLSRFVHTQTQLRLAIMGASRGVAVELEPGKNTEGPGDVRIGPLYVEATTFSEHRKIQEYAEFRQRCMFHLLQLESRHDVHWEGSYPELLTAETERADWRSRTETAAVQCAETGEVADVVTGETVLTVRAGRAPNGTQRTGVVLEDDTGRRFLGRVRAKCEQTRGAGTAWIWVEDLLGITHPLLPATRMPLPERVDTFAELLLPLLGEYLHVAGIVVSNVSPCCLPLPADENTERRNGWGLRRGLPTNRLRETIVIPRRLILPDQTAFLLRMLAAEPDWLPWALDGLGVFGGISSLLNPHPHVRRVE